MIPVPIYTNLIEPYCWIGQLNVRCKTVAPALLLGPMIFALIMLT
jgi:hypothetical protein